MITLLYKIIPLLTDPKEHSWASKFTSHSGAYTKYTYAVNLNKEFAPGDLLRAPGDPATEGGNQVISAIIVGLIAKF